MTNDFVVAEFEPSDVAELLVLQRCCWTQEALANNSLTMPPLTESHDDILAWTREWTTVVVRVGGRLVGAGRGRAEAGGTWHIGRLMVAPDLAGRGLGSHLLTLMETLAPKDTREFMLYTGAGSERNIRTYQRAGYAVVAPEIPPQGGVVVVTLRKPTLNAP